MVFQSYALFPHLSVAENVMFGLQVRRVAKRERLEKLHRALEITGLLGLEDRKPGELSGGQRQPAALARAQGAPVLLALHHPPFSCGIRFMDDIGLTNQQDFTDAVRGYAGELRIVCGHIHAMMIQTVAGHVPVSAPSPNSTFAYDRRPDAPVGFHTQEDGCLLHRWDGGFQSIRIGPNDGAGPFPFKTD